MGVNWRKHTGTLGLVLRQLCDEQPTIAEVGCILTRYGKGGRLPLLCRYS